MKLIKRSLTLNRKLQPIKHTVLSKKNFYIIQCQSNGFCLRQELKCYKIQEGDHVKIMGGQLIEPECPLSYLWTFQFNQNQNTYSIIHVRTNLNLSSQNFECELQHENPQDSQNFTLQEIKQNVFRIRDHNDNYLSLDGILQPNQYSQRDSSQEFMLKMINPLDVPALQGTGYILSQDQRRSLSLTNALKKNQNEIILQEQNFRINQRWVFQGVEPQKEDLGIRASVDRPQKQSSLKIYIRSALTQQFVTFNREHQTLMQSSYPQEWRLQKTSARSENEQVQLFHIEHIKLHKYLVYKGPKYQISLDQEPCIWAISNPEISLKNAYKMHVGLLHRHSI